jgi:hypothetical protein
MACQSLMILIAGCYSNVSAPTAASDENKTSFKINLLSYRSQQNLRCSKSKAIFQN